MLSCDSHVAYCNCREGVHPAMRALSWRGPTRSRLGTPDARLVVQPFTAPRILIRGFAATRRRRPFMSRVRFLLIALAAPIVAGPLSAQDSVVTIAPGP